MPDGHRNGNGKIKWLAYGLPLLAASAAVLGFMYTIGQRTSKINEVVLWKNETAPRLERMDREGTLSFAQFHTQYDKEQKEQYERLKDLEKETRQLEVMKQKIESLERAQLDRNPRYQPPEPRR